MLYKVLVEVIQEMVVEMVELDQSVFMVIMAVEVVLVDIREMVEMLDIMEIKKELLALVEEEAVAVDGLMVTLKVLGVVE